MLDFRYRVLDKEKARPLFSSGLKPYLIEQRSGARFNVPVTRVGQIRSVGNPVEDRVYFIFFANPGGYVKRGDAVTVHLGDFLVENLTVE
jgi:hypothetical protein